MAISVGMGECPASPYLSLSLFSIPPLLFLLQLSLLISPSLFLYPPTLALSAPHHTPPPLFLSARIFRPLFPLYTPPSPPHPTRLLPPPPPPPPPLPSPHPLLHSERMFQPLHTDSSGILCVEMFLLDPQALTIYWTKARAPLLKAWHL